MKKINDKFFNLKEYFEKPPQVRRKKRIDTTKSIRRGCYQKVDDKYKDPMAVLEWAKGKHIASIADLRRKREDGEPGLHTIVNLFDSWGRFKKQLSKKTEIVGDVPTNPEYIVNVVLDLEIYTSTEYERVRKKSPDLVPPKYWVLYHFGMWKNLWYVAEQVSLQRATNKYVLMKKKLGYWPTYTECKRKGLDITQLINIFDGKKKKLDAWLDKVISVGGA